MKSTYNSNLYELQWLSQYLDEQELVSFRKRECRRIRSVNKNRLNRKLLWQVDYDLWWRINLERRNDSYETISTNCN